MKPNYSNEEIDYGTPFKHTDGKWYYPDYESNGEGGMDVYPAAEVEDEGLIAKLEREELTEQLKSLRLSRESLNVLEDLVYQQKQSIDKRIDETIIKLYPVKFL